MVEPFILINTYAIKEGKLKAFKEHWQEIVEFVETNEPRR